MRKIIQILESGNQLTALCDDGSVWFIELDMWREAHLNGSGEKSEWILATNWIKLPADIPTD